MSLTFEELTSRNVFHNSTKETDGIEEITGGEKFECRNTVDKFWNMS